MFNGNLVSVHSTGPAIHHTARTFRQPGGVTESSTARAVLTWPLQAAAVPLLGYHTLLSLAHPPPQLLLIWSRTLLSQLVWTDAAQRGTGEWCAADGKGTGECCPPSKYSTATAGSKHPSSPHVPLPLGFLLQSHVPSPSTDLFSCQSAGLTNIPISLKSWSGDPEALMADASIMTLSAFPIVFALGSKVSFSHWAWPWEILNAKSTWAQEGAGLPSSVFSPL